MPDLFNSFFGDNIFRGLEADDSHRNGGVTISFGIPKTPEIIEDFGFMNRHIGHMMRKMNEQMNQMMGSMKTSMSQMMRAPSTSGGKMYIMESGPGYHEEKTYDIGPDGKMTLIKNDMSKTSKKLLGQ